MFESLVGEQLPQSAAKNMGSPFPQKKRAQGWNEDTQKSPKEAAHSIGQNAGQPVGGGFSL